MRAVLLCALLLTAGLTGCIGEDSRPSEANLSAQNTSQASSETLGTNATAEEPAAAPSSEAEAVEEDDPPRAAPTLDAAPDWRVGDWWTIRLEHPYSGQEHTVTQVVADVEGGIAVVGTAQPPHRDLMLLQAPLWGTVTLGGLSTDLATAPFQPVTFPLEEETSWETTLNGRDVTATVVQVDRLEAQIRYLETEPRTGLVEGIDEFPLEATGVYDASVATLRSFASPVGAATINGDQHGSVGQRAATWELLDHGTGYEGQVFVAENRTVVLDLYWNGFVDDPVVGVGPQAAPEAGASVPATATDVSLMLAAGFNRAQPNTIHGQYHVHTIHRDEPAGTEIASWHIETGPYRPGTGIVFALHGSQVPEGHWEARILDAAGLGEVMAKAVAYTLVKYDAPGGQANVLG